MNISFSLLYQLLSEQYPISRYGRGLDASSLPLPVFYTRSSPLKKGAVYVARTQDLPAVAQVECLFICVGGRPTYVTDHWPGEVLYVVEPELDLLSLFNNVQEIYEKMYRWSCQMWELVESKADIEELIRVSIPVFQNRIAITDYDLQVLAYCESVENAGHREMRICRKFDRVPEEKSIFFEKIHRQYIQRREPYIYKEPVVGEIVNQYCINLYLGDLYVGCCSLCEDLRPMRESDYLLFQQFAAYVRQALAAQSRLPSSQFATLKAILSELLQCFPVSRSDLDRALELVQKGSGLSQPPSYWCCIVIRSANRDKTLPAHYLCESLENMLPHCTAISWEGTLTAYCFLPDSDASMEEITKILEPYLRDMNFRAGISCSFEDIYKARNFYLQALSILKIGQDMDNGRYIYSFSDYILYYMLRHSGGEFEPEMLLSQGLRELRQQNGGVDFWNTLRQYLDNECNAARTAQDMFLHRSTLLPRLDKIKSIVNLDTPEQRLYLRMCIYLYDHFAGN